MHKLFNGKNGPPKFKHKNPKSTKTFKWHFCSLEGQLYAHMHITTLYFYLYTVDCKCVAGTPQLTDLTDYERGGGQSNQAPQLSTNSDFTDIQIGWVLVIWYVLIGAQQIPGWRMFLAPYWPRRFQDLIVCYVSGVTSTSWGKAERSGLFFNSMHFCVCVCFRCHNQQSKALNAQWTKSNASNRQKAVNASQSWAFSLWLGNINHFDECGAMKRHWLVLLCM